MGKIVAIGGGEFKDLETLPIEKEILKLSGKTHPRVLYIPTAGGDDPQWWEIFQNIYGKNLGCTVDVLWLLREKPTYQQIEEKILSADIIWVGGGNTLRMLKRWRKLSVDKALKKAYEKDIVLAGISAGSICWFMYGHSDSLSYNNPANKKLLRIRGLGFIPAIHSPHYHDDKKEKDFQQLIATYGKVGIALDNNTALEVVDDNYRILTTEANAHAYKLYKKDNRIIEEELFPSINYKPLSTLLHP